MPPGETVDELGGPEWLHMLVVFLSGLAETAMFLGVILLMIIQELVVAFVPVFRTALDHNPLNPNAPPPGPPPDPPPPPAYVETPQPPPPNTYQQVVRRPAVSPEATASILAREGPRRRMLESRQGSASGSSPVA